MTGSQRAIGVEQRQPPREAASLPEAMSYQQASAWRAFTGLLQRDIWNTVRHEPFAFLAQALLQPLGFLFVFGRVLPEVGAAGPGYAAQLLPGIIGLTLVLTALQNVALPLVIEFSYTKEIEDRLLAPLPPWAVGLEKLVFATVRATVAAALILPLAAGVLPNGGCRSTRERSGGYAWVGS